MRPITIFDSHFRAAQVLLKVYRLLDSDEELLQSRDLLPKLREVIQCGSDEPIVLLLNDLFLGLVRERAEVPPNFFKRSNLNLLLRQSVVSACTAMDVYFPALLDAYLPTVIQIRQRNFLPPGGDVRQLFRDFRLRLDELPALLEEPESSGRWSVLARRILEYCGARTMANASSIAAVMLLLGVDQPWKQLSARSGLPEESLRSQIATLIKRRNDIVHRGDRVVGQLDADPQPIDYAWTSAHISGAQSVVLACDALAMDRIQRLKTEAGVV